MEMDSKNVLIGLYSAIQLIQGALDIVRQLSGEDISADELQKEFDRVKDQLTKSVDLWSGPSSD